MKLSPRASCSDLEVARRIAQRLSALGGRRTPRTPSPPSYVSFGQGPRAEAWPAAAEAPSRAGGRDVRVDLDAVLGRRGVAAPARRVAEPAAAALFPEPVRPPGLPEAEAEPPAPAPPRDESPAVVTEPPELPESAPEPIAPAETEPEPVSPPAEPLAAMLEPGSPAGPDESGPAPEAEEPFEVPPAALEAVPSPVEPASAIEALTGPAPAPAAEAPPAPEAPAPEPEPAVPAPPPPPVPEAETDADADKTDPARAVDTSTVRLRASKLDALVDGLVQRPPKPWSTVLQSAMFLGQSVGALLADAGGKLVASTGQWPTGKVEAIAARLLPMLEKARRFQPEDPPATIRLGSQVITAWRLQAEGQLLTAAFLAETPLPADLRPGIDSILRRQRH